MDRLPRTKGYWFKLSEPLAITAERGVPSKGDSVVVEYNYPHINKGLARRMSSFDNEDIRSHSVKEVGLTEFFSAL